MKSVGLDLTKEETIKAFSKMDKNGGGQACKSTEPNIILHYLQFKNAIN
jgi:hypothetical protein